MTDKRKPYKTYTREFKIEAVRLMEISGRPPTEIAIIKGSANLISGVLAVSFLNVIILIWLGFWVCFGSE